MKKIKVNLKERSYEIIICNRNYDKLGSFIKRLKVGKDAIVITNKKILSILGQVVKRSLERCNFSVGFEIIPDSEKAKSLPVWSRLITKIVSYDRNRDLFLIALGGGVVGDLSGFIASIYKRGISYIQVPTTLLSQVDSAIGGKTGIDLTCGKNLIGSFYQPRLVFSDISALESLPPREIRNGLAEIVKYGVIGSKNLFRYLEFKYSGPSNHPNFSSHDWEYIISECSKIKAKIVEKDERDRTGLRMLLNFGHTIGHGIEAASEYSHIYHHGETIALGMIVAAEIGKELEITRDVTVKRIKNLIYNIGLPNKIRGIKLERIMQAIGYDKKFKGGKTRMVFPLEIGKVAVKENIPWKLIRKVIRRRLA